MLVQSIDRELGDLRALKSERSVVRGGRTDTAIEEKRRAGALCASGIAA